MTFGFLWPATIAAAALLLWCLLEGDAFRERAWAACAGAPALRDRGVAMRRALQRMLFAAASLPLLAGLLATHDPASSRTWLAALLALLVVQGLTIAATIDEGATEIPDLVTLPLLALAVLLGASGVFDGAFLSPGTSSLGAGFGLALGTLLPAALGRGMQSVGGADVLLLGTIGAVIGVAGLAVSLTAAGMATVALRSRLQREDGALPYAPGLALGFGLGAAVASWLCA